MWENILIIRMMTMVAESDISEQQHMRMRSRIYSDSQGRGLPGSN